MQTSGMQAKLEPRNLLNGFVPRTLQHDPSQQQATWALQGAMPDLAYDDRTDGKWKIVEFKGINQNPTSYPGWLQQRCTGVNC